MKVAEIVVGQVLDARPDVDELRRTLLPPGRQSRLVALSVDESARPHISRLRDDLAWMSYTVAEPIEREKWYRLALKVSIIFNTGTHILAQRQKQRERA